MDYSRDDLEQMMADKDLPYANLFLSHDLEGKPRPIESYKFLDGKYRRIKAVQQPDLVTFKDFAFMDDDWTEIPANEPGPMIIRGIGSSEVQDVDGDVMHKSALQSMCSVEKGLNVWIGHHMDDEHLFGSLIESPKMTYIAPGEGKDGPLIRANKGYAAVEVASDVEDENPRALKSARYIKKGRQFGYSVGCFFTKFDKRVMKGRVVGADVHEVAVFEWSVVPMPNNQQSWCKATHKAFVRKGFLVDEALNSDENTYRVVKCWDHFPEWAQPKMLALQQYLEDGGIYLCSTDPRLANTQGAA